MAASATATTAKIPNSEALNRELAVVDATISSML
jgi:hypothetical protein